MSFGLGHSLHALALVAVCLGTLAGCGDPKVSTPDELAAFDRISPPVPQVDVDRLAAARTSTGSYKVVAGDVVELDMPAVVRAVDPDAKGESISCRVDSDGTLTLPVAGKMKVLGLTLGEIEAGVTEIYYPRFIYNRPIVSTKVAEYKTEYASVIGAVKEPGQYALRSDEMSLVNLLMKAGGILPDGAGVIRIIHAGDGQSTELSLPVKGMNVPFADVELQPGDKVEVEHLAPQVFTVTGLVNKGGAFPYPPDVQYNLMQSISFAGGLLDRAAPDFVTVYRRTNDGKVASAVLKVDRVSLIQSSDIGIKPGDVVAVEPTPTTKARMFFLEVFRLNGGAYAGTTYNPTGW